jgi:hypothetical protein
MRARKEVDVKYRWSKKPVEEFKKETDLILQQISC